MEVEHGEDWDLKRQETTFLAPLFLIFHMVSIAQARKWSAAARSGERVLRAAPHVAL